MSATDPLFGAIPAPEDAAGFLDELAEGLRHAGRWDEVLEVRLMQARLAQGLPVDAASLSTDQADSRGALEADYAAACLEVGQGLLEAGRWADAWFYLKTGGHERVMREALGNLQPDEEQAETLIGIALHEGADPSLGFGWLLQHYGTCMAVTTLEGLGPHLPPEDLTGCAAALIEHLHEELLENVRGHIERKEGHAPELGGLPELYAQRDWLFENEGSHVDASHLSAAVRMARVLERPESVRAALHLADYGARLHESLHYPEAPPFEDIYHSHRRFFAAQLGEDVEAAVNYFRGRAEQTDIESQGQAPLETLIVLLNRVGRPGEALREFSRLSPAEIALSTYAPRPIDLARSSGEWGVYEQAMLQRGDIVGFTQGRIAQGERERRSDS